MYPDMVRDFLGRTTVGKQGGTMMTNAHSIIWIEECNFHRRPIFPENSTLLIGPVSVRRELWVQNIDYRGTNVVSKKVHYLPTAYLGEKA